MGRRQTRAPLILFSILAVLLLLDAGAIYTVGTHHHSPHFSAGGSFARAGTGGVGAATGRSGIGILGSSTTTPAQTATAEPAATTTTTTGVGVTTTSLPIVGVGGASPSTTVPSPPSTVSLPTSAGSLPTSAGLTPAADGVYTYALAGNESSTLGRRSFPSTMTIDVHGAPGINAQTEAVFDLNFSSNHTEREIVDWGPSGVAWTYEAGQVKFGLITQTNQGTYSPPMLQIPAQLTPGTAVTGSSTAVAGNTVKRVEDWTDTVGASSILTLAGQPVPTVEVSVHRVTRPGAGETTTRTTEFWYSPAIRMWAKFSEQLQGQQTELGITFTYTESFIATLVGYSPG